MGGHDEEAIVAEANTVNLLRKELNAFIAIP